MKEAPMATNKCVPAAYYQDPAAALDWLERAFGFETTMRITDGSGNVVHAEMEAEGERIMIGPGGWSDFAKNPHELGGANTQNIHLEVPDVARHYARAKQAGAMIVADLEDQFYGAKTYRVVDLGGHVWSFSQHVRDVPLKEAGEKIGLTVELIPRS
jgi:uncharacterized glyoxalase superfamily protein PhnB